MLQRAVRRHVDPPVPEHVRGVAGKGMKPQCGTLHEPAEPLRRADEDVVPGRSQRRAEHHVRDGVAARSECADRDPHELADRERRHVT